MRCTPSSTLTIGTKHTTNFLTTFCRLLGSSDVFCNLLGAEGKVSRPCSVILFQFMSCFNDKNFFSVRTFCTLETTFLVTFSSPRKSKDGGELKISIL